MWNVPKIWEGGRCFIIGGGPSMPRQFGIPSEVIQRVFLKRESVEAYSPYLHLLHSQHVIGVNEAFKIGKWVDIAFWGDDGWYKTNKEKLLEFKGLRVTCMHKIDPECIHRVKKLNRDNAKQSGISIRPGLVSWNRNSGAAAINLAYHLGVKQIILLGFDMKLDQEQNQHWHKSYAGNPRTVVGTFKMHLRGFPSIAEDAQKLGIEILNANPDSAITAFRKVDIKEVL